MNKSFIKYAALIIVAVVLTGAFTIFHNNINALYKEYLNKKEVKTLVDNNDYMLSGEYYNYSDLTYDDYLNLKDKIKGNAYFTATHEFFGSLNNKTYNLVFMGDEEFKRLFGISRNNDTIYLGEGINSFKERAIYNISSCEKVDFGFLFDKKGNSTFKIGENVYALQELPKGNEKYINYESFYLANPKRSKVSTFGVFPIKDSIILPLSEVDAMIELEKMDKHSVFSRVVFEDKADMERCREIMQAKNKDVKYKFGRTIDTIDYYKSFVVKNAIKWLALATILFVASFFLIKFASNNIVLNSVIVGVSAIVGTLISKRIIVKKLFEDEILWEKPILYSVFTVGALAILFVAINYLIKINNVVLKKGE